MIMGLGLENCSLGDSADERIRELGIGGLLDWGIEDSEIQNGWRF